MTPSDEPRPASERRWRFYYRAIIPFPAKHRIGKIRRTAERIDNATTERAAEGIWRQAVIDMRRQMERAQVSPEAIQHEIEDFAQAVRDELVRRSYGQSTWFDGGDAA